MTVPRSSRPLCVLLYGSDSTERARRRQQLHGLDVLEPADAQSLCQAIGAARCDVLIICDAALPEVNLLDRPRRPSIVWIAAAAQPGIADVLLSPTVDADEFRECIHLLGNRCQVLDELEQLSVQVQDAFTRHRWRGSSRWHGPQELLTMALTDPLTGIFSRRHFEDSLCQEFERARSSAQPLSLLLVDLDQFKPVNDTRGHRAGDIVLIEVAKRLRHSTRASDIVCRYGGDEFAVISPGTTIDAAMHIANRLGHAISASPYSHELETIRIGCSVGIASLPHSDIQTLADLCLQADRALIAAKRAGGGRVCAAHEIRGR